MTLSDTRSRLRRLALASLTGLALAACSSVDLAAPRAAAQPVEVAPLPAEAKQMFLAVYRQVHRRHMEPVSTVNLAAAGIDGLRRIDPAIRAQRMGKDIEILYGQDSLAREIDFETADLDHAANVTVAAIDAARQRSAGLREASAETIYAAAIGAIARSLDQFSSYRPPQQARAANENLLGFGGIGMTLNADGPVMKVAGIQPGSPADKGQIRVGDTITGLDGESVAGWTLQDVVARVRGAVGQPVEITLMRGGLAEPLKVTLTRARIVPSSVVFRREGDIAHIRLTSFNTDTHLRLTEAIEAARAEIGPDLKGIVLDMRSNPGGTWSSMLRIADLFIADGPLMNHRARLPAPQQTANAIKGELAEHMPVVVLINGRSASASEVVAAALFDHGRAVLIGSTTVGKASAQVPVSLPNGGSIAISSTHLFTPAGYSIHGRGILPALCTAHFTDASDPSQARVVDEDEVARWREANVVTNKPFLETCPRANGERAAELTLALDVLHDRARYEALLRPAQGLDRRIAKGNSPNPN